MESITPEFDNSSTESVVSFHTVSVTDDVTFINRLLMQMIQTLDVEELLTVYHLHIRQVLPLLSCSLGGEDRCITRGLANPKQRQPLVLGLNAEDNPLISNLPVMRYWFSRSISISEKSLLSILHQAFSHAAIHALSFSRLSQLATKDALTGLSNRGAFNEDAEQMRQAMQRTSSHFGLLVLDLDNFKSVNDNFGHKEGDNVLITFADVLTKSLRANEKAYRFGGDEFCCLLDTRHDETINLVAKRILDSAAKARLLKRHGVTASIGGTLSRIGESASDTFNRADQALYDVKQQGKHGYLLN